MQLPSVRLGIDASKAQIYQREIVEGINIYYSDSVASNFKMVTLRLEKLLFFKKLIAVSER